MTSAHDFGPPRDQGELTALAKVLAEAFALSEAFSQSWCEGAGVDVMRVLRQRGTVLAGLVLVPMGQFFGGRRVSSTGVAGVGVPPAARGKGVATALMQRTLRELREDGVALSTLYASTVPLYRRVGYEPAGGNYQITLCPRDLGKLPRELRVRPLEDADEARVEWLYRNAAQRRDGWLDRNGYIWSRTRRDREGVAARGYVLAADDGPAVAYVRYHQRRAGLAVHMTVTDLAATTAAGLGGLLSFFADHATLAEEISWTGGIDDPLVALLPDRHYQLRLLHHWMLRIVDVQAALSERGYPACVDTSLGFVVHDDVLPDNAGRWLLETRGGRGELRRGGRGGLELDARALAALYSGHSSAHALATQGRLRGSAKLLDRAATLFAGRPPSMPDMF